MTPPQLERARRTQQIIPMSEEKSWLDRTSNERTDMLISNTLVDTIEGLIRQIAQAWREL